MDRKRTVAAASGISVVLVAGSSAFAFANGIFIAHPVARVGSLNALQARLVPETRPTRTAPVVAPNVIRVTRPLSTAPNALAPTHVSEIPPTTTPEIVATPAPTSGPMIARYVVRATAPVVAHSGPSTVPGHHSEDDHELGEGGHSDD
jgi:hypothetical protein